MKRIPLVPGPLAARPRLATAVAIGLAAAAALFLVPNPLQLVTRVIVAWDMGCSVFIGAILFGLRGETAAQMRRRAESQDEGAGAILVFALVAAVVSLGAIILEISQAKGGHGLAAQLRILLAFVTVAVSWSFVQVIFAVHYAHEYYAPGPQAGDVRGGLQFLGGDDPDYWDFLHFALVIGVAAQTADIAFTSKTQRRIGTLHSVVAFTFNTLVLALSINLAASLF